MNSASTLLSASRNRLTPGTPKAPMERQISPAGGRLEMVQINLTTGMGVRRHRPPLRSSL